MTTYTVYATALGYFGENLVSFNLVSKDFETLDKANHFFNRNRKNVSAIFDCITDAFLTLDVLTVDYKIEECVDGKEPTVVNSYSLTYKG